MEGQQIPQGFQPSEGWKPLPLANQYELDEKPGLTREKLYLGGDHYSAGAVLVRDNGGAWQVFYINSDYLGSITHVVNSAGAVVAEYSYDAWGRLRNPGTHVAFGVNDQPELFFGRGYTGHEHLNWFGLINMNARLYDPVYGRFLAPDPYVQAPDFTQSFNRYGYVFNNPLSFTDATGEIAWFVPIIIGAAIGAYMGGAVANNDFNPTRWDWRSGRTWAGIGGGLVTGALAGAGWSFGLSTLNGSAWVGGKTVISGISLAGKWKLASGAILIGKGITAVNTATSMVSNFNNAARIMAGKYYLNERVSFGDQLLHGLSRFTWEGVQTWAGYNYSQIRNTAGKTDRVDYFGGVTFSTSEKVTNFNGWEGASHGNFILTKITGEITGDFRDYVLSNPLYMHEYGHTFDSRRNGWLYYFKIGIPSSRGARWTEIRANVFAAQYFAQFGVDWDPFLDRYPLN